MSAHKSAFDVLMHGRRKRKSEAAFPCPAGCGASVTERAVNAHLDSACPRLRSPRAAADDARRPAGENLAVGGAAAGRGRRGVDEGSAPATNTIRVDPQRNAFSRMMKSSAAVFSKANHVIPTRAVVRQRFHLHSAEGRVSWTCEDDSAAAASSAAPAISGDSPSDSGGAGPDKHGATAAKKCVEEEATWSAIVTMKKVKCIYHAGGEANTEQTEQTTPAAVTTNTEKDATDDAKALELTISSSLPSMSGDGDPARSTPGQRLVRRHSRLSVSQLKSCLQKSVRRRAPLPAVRVALELADRSRGDLLRRLPVIALEDSALHPDFGLLVWMMVAESKGYVPGMALLRRVMQIVFEVASCPKRDAPSAEERSWGSDESELPPPSLSLTTPTAQLFPRGGAPPDHASEVHVRAMLLRAQYGGMRCDVGMLQSFAAVWRQRFRREHAAPLSSPPAVKWSEVPRRLHEGARTKSEELVTAALVRPGGLAKLTPTDVCAAGIDFHCSAVVERLLSRPTIYAALRERLTRDGADDGATEREHVAGQLKRMIWHHSSGINHRMLLEGQKNRSGNSGWQAAWDDVVKQPFGAYTRQFVRDRLG